MNEPSFLEHMPGWIKSIAYGIGAFGVGGLLLRQWLSKASLNRAVDAANVATIKRLQKEAWTERKRADGLMREREAMVQKIGELTGKVDELSKQVDSLAAVIRELRGAVNPE